MRKKWIVLLLALLCALTLLVPMAAYAELVRLCAMDCSTSVACGAEESDYDVGLAGITTLQTSPVPVLTPENRSVSLYITYQNVDLTGADGNARTCTIRWYIDGVQQPLRTVALKNSKTPGFTVSESVWKRNMPSSRTVKVELLYGTDVVTTQFVVPIQNYTDTEYAKLTSAAKPYQLEVVCNQCTVLVYGLDKSGNYSILHHAFVCGPGQTTPLGTVCSHGCVRLTCVDAKWIYDNCPIGTTVRIYDSSTLPVPKPTAPWLDVTSPYRGWDPTDPNPNNPWKK